MKRKVKIASLIWYKFLPVHFGGQKVIDSLNTLLSSEFDFIVICSKNNFANSQLQFPLLNVLPISKWQILNPLVWLKIVRVLNHYQITHLVLEHPYHVITAQLAKWFLKIKLIHHVHNIEHIRFKYFKNIQFHLIEILEKWMFKISNLNIFLSQEDEQYAISNKLIKSESSFILPYIITEKDVANKLLVQQKIKQHLNISKETNILFFNGTLDYKPNSEAIENIFEKIVLELNQTNIDFKIIICGRIENEESQYLKKYFNQQIIYAGHVDNIEEYFLTADVYINPVQVGFGVQTKILEALSYHLPVVCFKSILNGIETSLCKEKLFIASNWHSFNSNIIEALQCAQNLQTHFFEFYNINSYSSSLKKRIESL